MQQSVTEWDLSLSSDQASESAPVRFPPLVQTASGAAVDAKKPPVDIELLLQRRLQRQLEE